MRCEVLILILGVRYGYVAVSGRSPTEEEFDRAVEEGIPVLAFIQEDVEREPAQEAFLQRVRGTWGTGVFAPGFHTPTELGFAIVRSLRQLEEGAADADALPAARQRAVDLAGSRSNRGYASGSAMRVVLVPVGTSALLNAAALDDPALGDRIASIARAHGLVAQATGIDVAIRADAITAIGKGDRGSSDTTVILLPEGAVCIEADVRADGMLGGSGHLSSG